jgi:hypothetical protein
MTNYLTQADVNDYGSDLVDFAQRAAIHAVAPHLRNLEQQNADLQRRLAKEARHRLDQQVAAAIPNFREIDQDSQWHRWLLQPDSLSGRVRQQLLNDAIANADAGRVISFFRGFQQEHRAGGTHAPGRVRPASSKPTYTRDQIRQLYEHHRRGAYAGSEDDWRRQEQDIIAAGREGRIQAPDYITK